MPPPVRENATFVFHDARGHRWPRVKRVVFAFSIVLFLGLVFFVRSLLIRPELRLPSSVRALRSQLQGIQPTPFPGGTLLSKPDEAGPRHTIDPIARARQQHHRSDSQALKKITLGFFANRDHAALDSLRRHGGQLTHLSPEWMIFKNEACDLELRDSTEVEELAVDHGLKLVPLLTNFHEGWRGDLMAFLVTSPLETQDRFIQSAISIMKAHSYAGITVDFEEVALEYGGAFNDFLVRFADHCHREKLLFLLCIPVGYDCEVFDLDRLSSHVDYFIGMLYDQNSPHDPPGPIASQPWFERWLKRLLEFGRPSQWIIGIGAFGCDWPDNGPVGKTLGFADIMATASRTDLPHIAFSKIQLNPTFSYREGDQPHTVWFLDAVTALNQARSIKETATAGIAVWRLGLEDPQLWDALRFAQQPSLSQENLDALRVIEPQDRVIQLGEGEIVRADEDLQDGLRVVHRVGNTCFSAIYSSFPGYVILSHEGVVNPNWICLTFDDGPDLKWTPKILDILAAEKIHATFFVVGRNVEKHPELIVRMLHEGHEIGNHSYTHPNLADIPEVQVDIELNATQRLLESIIGRSTILFRPPFLADSRPQTRSEVLPILRAQKLGYVTLCENIDPEDWARPGADTILKRIKNQRGYGSVVLLHDGGGDRSQTVEALPHIIHWLRERSRGGVEFVTASHLLHISRDETMPPAPPGERMIIATSSYGLEFLGSLEETLWAVMILASILVMARALLIAILAMIQKWRSLPSASDLHIFPAVSILIAAYNEEKVIGDSIRSVLENGYAGDFEIVVVNDGSTDQTSRIVSTLSRKDFRLRLHNQTNLGKSSALARAAAMARHEILVSLDADTQLDRGALASLVRPFVKDSRIGAVSGNAHVGNRGCWLTEFQSLEYICSFNLDRRAYDLLNCITVVPGAIGAYRRCAVVQAGGFTAETLAEDTDLTLHIRKDGWRIAYAERAVGRTESPETLKGLFHQRFRWIFGTMQCLWKHRDALFNPRYGTLAWVALPGMWFSMLLVAATPLVDILMILSLLAGNGMVVALYFIAFILCDIVLGAIALALENENLFRAFLILPQRLFYRPLLSIVVWGSIRRAIRGVLVGWGKQERTATVRKEQTA